LPARNESIVSSYLYRHFIGNPKVSSVGFEGAQKLLASLHVVPHPFVQGCRGRFEPVAGLYLPLCVLVGQPIVEPNNSIPNDVGRDAPTGQGPAFGKLGPARFAFEHLFAGTVLSILDDVVGITGRAHKVGLAGHIRL
jgi:hypothetical protein